MHCSQVKESLQGQGLSCASAQVLASERGQGTIEYLVILAVIVVLGLVVVSLVSGLTNTNSTVRASNELSSKLGYGGISIMESASDPQGDAVVSMKNISGEDLVIRQISVCGVSGDYGVGGETFVAGSTVNFILNGTNLVCTAIGSNDLRECDIEINAESIYTVGHNISGSVYLSCVSDVSVNGPVFSAQSKRPIITMFSPLANYSSTSPVVDFNFSIADENSAVTSCILKINEADLNTISNPVLGQLYSKQNSLTVGSHDWNLRCTDANSNIAYAIGSITINPSSTVSPVITMLSPVQPTYSTFSSVNDFNFLVNDSDSVVSNCILTIDGVDLNTVFSPTLNQVYSLRNSLAVGSHDWNLVCTDTSNNTDLESGAIIIQQVLSSAKAITAFNFASPSVTGSINEGLHTISLSVPSGTNVTSLTPTITISPSAVVSPASGVAQNFSSPVIYRVTAQDSSTQDYNVTVTIALSSAKSITSFSLPVVGSETSIDQTLHKIRVQVPIGTTLTSLSPTISISSGATISPLSGVAQNFSNGLVYYTVTAEDNSTQQYDVNVFAAIFWQAVGSSGNWTVARDYCAALTEGGLPAGTWRLPSSAELTSACTSSVGGFAQDIYWGREGPTTDQWGNQLYRMMDFRLGQNPNCNFGLLNVTYWTYVRCVR
ncbi:MAG: DUF5018 domain-containing protein [archaeon]|jgi:hypothetical protein